MSDSKQSRKINRFFAEFIAKLRKWLNKIGSPIRISRQFVRQLLGATKGKRKGGAAGFVLPTVTLVTLIVTLLVVTTVSRSSERAQTASNARTEQVFKSSATPIIDRARIKIDALLNDDRLPRTTPPEEVLDSVITNDSSSKYTFPDETRLQLVYNFPGSANSIVTGGNIENKEYVSTAWKLPIDTDNNGKFDSYGIYSILLRARPKATIDRPVIPIESRALPMDETTLAGACTQANSGASVASDGGWTLSGNRLRKSFFVYSVTVPITARDSFPAELTEAQKDASYELFNGVTSISALELQQDRARSPQNNNAVFFEGDLELVNVATFRLNGRVYTAGSMMVGAGENNPITFYQVSSSGGNPTNPSQSTTNPNEYGSCYYEKKNSEIIVAGQLVEGDAVTDTLLTNKDRVNVDLFFGAGSGVPPFDATATNPPGRKVIDSSNKSVSDLSSRVALNDFAYNNRIAALVTEAVRENGNVTAPSPIPANFSVENLTYANTATKDPISVQEDLVKRIKDEALTSPNEFETARRAAFTGYFGERTRRVSFGQIPFTTVESFNPITSNLLTRIPVAGKPGEDELAPRVDWMLPVYTNPSFGKPVGSYILATGAGFDGEGAITGVPAAPVGGLTLLNTTNPNRLNLMASDPDLVVTANESELGDRILVGNGLPARWLKRNDITNQLEFVGDRERNLISTVSGASGVSWDNPTGAGDRYRNTRSVTLNSLGVTDRGGFWEISASLDPAVSDPADITKPLISEVSPRTGGLRVVTNAGIYSRLPAQTFLPRFRTGFVDNPLTTDVDESGMPLWDGKPIDNPITPVTTVDESKFANFVVWQDSMPMTPEPRVRLLNSTTTPARAVAGSYILDSTSLDGWSQTIPNPVPNADIRKGDLQMRASAIYHYKYDAYNPIGAAANYQTPIACVSSYYDPSTTITARNAPVGASPAPWNPDPNGRSNNGLVYRVGQTATGFDFSGITKNTAGVFVGISPAANNPASTATTLRDRLAYQANLIFPNGRFVNEPLREVITKLTAIPPSSTLTLPQQSTLDSNLCALQILDGTLTLANTTATSATITPAAATGSIALTAVELPHGAFRESSFLDGREVKSLNRNESLTEGAVGNEPRNTGDATQQGLAIATKNRADIYDLELEQRQPLEIRATDIDMDRLRGSRISGGNNAGLATDFLLPYSGLIYATREDALEDLSYFDKDPTTGNPLPTNDVKRKNLSSTDFLLDPTRKPSSIRLINGYRLWRSDLTNTANLPLPNLNGTLAVSNTAYASYPLTDPTRGEKGLALVSNLPVYIKAQADPANAAAIPSFNRHTRQEFTQPLNEDITNPANIWNNFYRRHANVSPTDRLDPNFACRPNPTTQCTLGDEWRPATVLADSVTVLSSNFRDGYRTDGDFDLRNNANTSTSINWQSQLNPTRYPNDPIKDSSYVLDRRRSGFFNNSFVTSSPWLQTLNSDGAIVPDSNVWPASPASNPPNNGNLASYNANGVTPIQRRINFPEYGMEICRKVPVGECTFSDWVKAGAGTTTLPGFIAAGTIQTTGDDDRAEVGSPRSINPGDFRFARRLSFLRFDDIYKDGNHQLIFAGSCRNPAAPPVIWPMAIGITNGFSADGFTYPQVMGDRPTPFGISNDNNSSYGTVPCPELGIRVTISNDQDLAEGRRRDQNSNLQSLEAQLGNNNLPVPVFANALSVTNDPDNTTSITAPLPTNRGGRSTNNAVYRRFNFNVQIEGPDRVKLAAGQSIRVRVTLRPTSPVVQAQPGEIVASNPPVPSTGLTSTFPTISSTVGADYLNRLINPNAALAMTVPSTVNTQILDVATGAVTNNATGTIATSIPVTANGGQYPRLRIGPSSAETVNPEVATCPVDSYCTVLTWTGPTEIPSDPTIKTVTVFVVRDSAFESNEDFQIGLDNIKGPQAIYGSNRTRRGQIQPEARQTPACTAT